jgi:hypothetical protein
MKYGCMEHRPSLSVYEEGVDSPESGLLVDGSSKGICFSCTARVRCLIFVCEHRYAAADIGDEQKQFLRELQRWG